mgnify:FL=1
MKLDIKSLYYFNMRRIIYKSLFHRFLSPTLLDFSKFFITYNPEDLIKKLLGTNISETIKKEYLEVSTSLESRYNSIKLEYPLDFKIENNTSFFVYAFMRLYQPLKVVETGVANGHSTFIILSALAKNGKGKLYSIDVSPNVGSLLTEDLKRNWELIVLPKANKKALDKVLKNLHPIDLFIHDSNHLYYWQEVEYNTAFKYVKSQGFIMSDDADFSYAFLDFIRDKGLDAYFLYDTRKIFGITRKN